MKVQPCKADLENKSISKLPLESLDHPALRGEMLPPNSVLLPIDVQKGFDDLKWGRRNNLQAESNIVRLIQEWRTRRMPIVHVRHHSTFPGSPLAPGQPGADIKAEVAPLSEEWLVTKFVNSAFIGTNLDRQLRDRGVQTLVICGLTTDHCVSTTARMAGNLGYQTFVVSDATATFDRLGFDGTTYPAEEVHALALASLHGEFATVLSTEDILGRLLP